METLIIEQLHTLQSREQAAESYSGTKCGSHRVRSSGHGLAEGRWRICALEAAQALLPRALGWPGGLVDEAPG